MGAGALIVGGSAGYILTRPKRELNLLAWSGYEEADFLAPFENSHGVKVNVRTYPNPDQMVSILLSSPGQFDLVVVDPEYIPVLVGKGALRELDYSILNLSSYFPFFQDHELTKVNGRHFAVPIRFGVNALVYNTELLSQAQTQSYGILFDPKVRGRLGVWDWYLPNMGVISRSLGNPQPYNLTDSELETVGATLMRLKPLVGSLHSSLP
jgi:spermidine/putrescine transport system substrate-binding protein